MRISFTGTSHRDLTKRQWGELLAYLTKHREEINRIHHGDCINADTQFHALVEHLGMRHLVVLHPPRSSKKRAFCSAPISAAPTPYLKRNRKLATICDVLLAAPAQEREIQRSGTWATIRYARALGRPVKIFIP